jgi:hypothetical protein
MPNVSAGATAQKDFEVGGGSRGIVVRNDGPIRIEYECGAKLGPDEIEVVHTVRLQPQTAGRKLPFCDNFTCAVTNGLAAPS